MRARIQQWLYQIQGSYWFVPALMAIGAIFLSQVSVQLDRQLGSKWVTDSGWASLNQPEGARTLLATVAGSMITVAGVTFSLTILAVSYATTHFGPRLLDNFMRDRGNQVTLGTFLATFLYCLLVLRTVRSGSDIFDPGEDAQLFVPHLSVLLAVGMTLASVGVLIYFIHHIPESIHVSNVLSRISNEFSSKVEDLYPESLGEGARELPRELEEPFLEGKSIRSLHAGYLQGIDETQLMESCEDCDTILQLHVRPGDYLLKGQKLATVSFQSSAEPSEQDRFESAIHGSLAIGVTRTPTQDIRFIISHFFEIAVRALSPGVNDPLTAIQCIDQLCTGLVELSARSLPPRFREDDEGQLRVITTETTWNEIVDEAFRRLIPYARRDVNVLEHLQEQVEHVLEISQNDELNPQLSEVVREVRELRERGEH